MEISWAYGNETTTSAIDQVRVIDQVCVNIRSVRVDYRLPGAPWVWVSRLPLPSTVCVVATRLAVHAATRLSEVIARGCKSNF